MQILILDDDQDFANGLAALIARMGHGVAIAHNCAAARTFAHDRDFDVILADVDLPDGDGRHVCDGLRAEGASQGAYMIAVTGKTDLGDDDFPSFDGYVRKPVTYDLLERVLEEWRLAAGLDRVTTVSEPSKVVEAR